MSLTLRAGTCQSSASPLFLGVDRTALFFSAVPIHNVRPPSHLLSLNNVRHTQHQLLPPSSPSPSLFLPFLPLCFIFSLHLTAFCRSHSHTHCHTHTSTHRVAAPSRLAVELGANYVADALLRSPALLGSLQVPGNPTGIPDDLLFLPLYALRQPGGGGLHPR